MGDRLQAWLHIGKESRKEGLGMWRGNWRQKEDKKKKTEIQFGLMEPKGTEKRLWNLSILVSRDRKGPDTQEVGVSVTGGRRHCKVPLLKELFRSGEQERTGLVVTRLWLLCSRRKWAAPLLSFSSLLIKTSPPLFPFLVLIKIFLWWHTHPFGSSVLEWDPWQEGTAPMLSSGLYSSEATLRQGDTNCWWGQAKKVSASDELPIHLRRQCSWAQLVVQVGNANWKNSELHQGIPHLLFPQSLLTFAKLQWAPSPQPIADPFPFSHNIPFTF